jgi:hypothetical protein
MISRLNTKHVTFGDCLKLFTSAPRSTPWLVLLLICSLASLAWSQTLEPKESTDYCVAIRGNGELAPAHWGAFAKTLETFGTPVGAAGGSSASITVFLFESMLSNPIVAALDTTEKKEALALLFKALEPLVSKVGHDSRFEEALVGLRMIQGEITAPPLQGFLAILAHLQNPTILKSTLSKLEAALRSLQDSQILNGPAIQRLSRDIIQLQQKFSIDQLNLVFAEVNDIKKSLAVFGKFNAKDDYQLFIRDGLLNFEALTNSFGALADFLSLRNATPAATLAFQSFRNACGSQTVGLNWEAIMTLKPECQNHLNQWVASYLPNYVPQANSRLHDPIGQTLSVITSTAIIQGDSVEKFKNIKAQYQRTFSSDLGVDMNVVKDEDLKFGYWGRLTDLEKMKSLLDPKIDKNSRFLSLGTQPWNKILAYSPAEPGLSAFLEYENVISMGGWSDLHPIPALKAIGCKNVVYLTRKQGDSIFAMGVAKRLLGMPELGWDFLEKDPANQADFLKTNLKNALGNEDTSSLWGRFFNIKNPESSFAYSLKLADAVVCTNWNAFDIKTDFHAMIDEAYQAPIFNRSNLPVLELPAISSPQLRFLKPSDYETKSIDGIPVFAGCIN